MYNILNGKLVRIYRPSAFPKTATTNGHELFFALGVGDLRDSAGIRAYSLPTINE